MKIKYLIYIVLFLTFISCEKSESDSGNIEPGTPNSGKSGSMAKFSISGDNLFIINEKDLKIFDISNESQPSEVNSLEVDFGIETVFSFAGQIVYRID